MKTNTHSRRKKIREHIAWDNATAALALDELFTKKAALLSDQPGVGRPGRLPGTRELVAHPSYILIYDVAEDLVRVLRVLHAAQQ